jgi:hypothetical protein
MFAGAKPVLLMSRRCLNAQKMKNSENSNSYQGRSKAMTADDLQSEDNDQDEYTLDESATEGFPSMLLDRLSDIFHDLCEALGANECNKYIHDALLKYKQGNKHRMLGLMTMHKAYVATINRFTMTSEQKRELIHMLEEAASTPYDDIIMFETSKLTEEQVEYARWIADAIYDTSVTLDVMTWML